MLASFCFLIFVMLSETKHLTREFLRYAQDDKVYFFVGAKIQHYFRTPYALTMLSRKNFETLQKHQTTLATAANVAIILQISKHSTPYLYI